MTLTTPHWQQVASRKQAARDALIPAEWRIPATDALSVIDVPARCGILSPAELAISETPADELVKALASGALKSYDVTLAFCKRSAVAQQLTNCLTEIFYEAALADAKALDEHLASTGKTVGPLHGLPVSLKDNFYVRGVDTTVGFTAWAEDPAKEEDESVMTRIMRESGAVLFCKTNVPTAMMMPESYNNVWDYTANPYNRTASSGGSSGGEGALLALKGSPVGVGTDIGGSIRIPAAFCGLYALKPSFGRFATYGARSGLPGQEAVRSINGPMSATLAGVEVWARAVVGSQPWLRDPNMVPIPWREPVLPAKLCFGLIVDNGIVRPTPPIQRALALTRAALEAAGHTVVEWSPCEPETSQAILKSFFEADGGVKIADTIAAGQESWPRGMHAYAEAYERATKVALPTVADYWATQAKRTSYAKRALDHWLASAEVTGTGRPFDGVISPCGAWNACPRYAFGTHFTYTSMWNVLDQPAATFPVTFVDPAKDAKTEVPARTPAEKQLWTDYDVEKLIGTPVSLQVIGKRLEEELVIELTKVIRDALKASA